MTHLIATDDLVYCPSMGSIFDRASVVELPGLSFVFVLRLGDIRSGPARLIDSDEEHQWRQLQQWEHDTNRETQCPQNT